MEKKETPTILSKEKQADVILAIKNLSFEIEGQPILKNISFSIQKNEIVALVGESGSGKSLTALSLLGLEPQKHSKLTADRMDFRDIALSSFTTKDWEHLRGNTISMIFQEPQSSLNPSMRCGQQVMEVLNRHTHHLQKEKHALVLQAFEEVQLPNPERIFRSYPHELSGGQKQRVMIAMALICKPQLLIADEPTTALDVTVQKEIIELLKTLQRKTQMSILFISHDLGVVKQLAHKVLVMYQGKIQESGETKSIFNDPQNPYTKGLLFARPKINQRLQVLPTLADYKNKHFVPYDISKKERLEFHKELYKKSPLLEVEGLEKKYESRFNLFQKRKHFIAVQEIDFKLYPGETLGLVGESGCGKSTLAKALIYLDPPTSGSIRYKGMSIQNSGKRKLRALRKEIQFIFQDPFAALNPLKTIGETVAEPLRIHRITTTKKETKARVLELLVQVGLSKEFYDRYPHELSGGQRQRAVIARALATEPKLIICDESVAALDISVQAQVLNLLNRLKRELGLSYLFISHDLSVVKFMSDRIMVMQKGRLVEFQEADSLYENPQNQYTKTLIAAIPN
ncbi:ABC transporter ATP-binding protein [Flavobacteriaceae bacterium]|nr:ABC transporter ATP-binding protein [Flavobacteriaceae bacterium]